MLLVSLFASLNVHAASLIKYQPTNECGGSEAAISHLITNTPQGPEVIAGRISSTAHVLANLRAVNDETQLAAMSSVLPSGFDANFARYWLLVKSDCASVRAQLEPALINSAANKKTLAADHDAAIATLKEEFKKTRYPSYESAAELASALKLGVDKGLWKLSAADLATLTPIATEMKAKDAQNTPKIKELAKNLEAEPPAHLKMNPQFQQIKKLITTENAEAAKALQALAAILPR